MTAIYRGMDRATLDREYAPRNTVASLDPYLERYAAQSAEMRATLPCHLDVAYGPSEPEVMDIFPAGVGAPIFVYIHGGYWRVLTKDESSFMARCFTESGVALAALSYALAPGASLDEIVRECRAAIAWLHRNGDEFGIDPDRIFVGGHSAGAHLTGMLVSCGWHEAFGVPENVIKGGIAVSGLYDLEPVRLGEPNVWLRLDVEAAARNSPMLHLPENGCPLIVAWGDAETSEFKRQSRDYAAAWAARGFPVNAFEVPGRNHYDVILDLADPSRRLAADSLAMISGG